MTGARIAAPLTVAVALAIAALTLAPRAFEAGFLLASRDDPVALADHAVARSFDATVATRELEFWCRRIRRMPRRRWLPGRPGGRA